MKIKLLAVFLLCAGAARADDPHIGYAFPAGGQQGTTLDVMIGGQHLVGATNIFVSGEGITVKIEKYSVKYEARRLRQMYRGRKNNIATLEESEDEKERKRLKERIERATKELAVAELPDGVDITDEKAVIRAYKEDPKEQFNPQLADRLRVTITIAKNAPTGERELRVYTPGGLSNPIYFQVAPLPEIIEVEPNDDHMSPELQLVSVPAIINGQVRPGDIDHFRFKASKGDTIVVDVSARRIIPYLADAVPGWFQAVVALYDEDGNEVAYQDDYKFHPDPVLFFNVPEYGTYTLSIRDSIYRGREDFIYRIAIGELPFITSIFPLGAEQGRAVNISLTGWNLPKTKLHGMLPQNGIEIRNISVQKKGYRSNLMPFAIDEGTEVFETEPNDVENQAQPVDHPILINGRIQIPGDRDVFKITGQKGDSVSIEVVARRLNSPLDSVISIWGPGMKQPERNDDYNNKNSKHLHLGAGLVTHHADSYLVHEFPETGTYFIEIGDAQSKGGTDYGYRLRISSSLPDFRLHMEPSGLHISPGGTAAFTVRVIRMDGFEEQITLSAANLPDGFKMSEAVIRAGSEMTRFTITAPSQIKGKLVNPEITGEGIINGKPATRIAIPVDDQMQAFLYRHLVPAQELILAPVSTKQPVVFEVRIPKSGKIEPPIGEEVRVNFDGRTYGRKGVSIKLDDPPDGISAVKNGWFGKKWLPGKTADGKSRHEKIISQGSILLVADDSLKPGTQLNIIVVAEARTGREKNFYPAPAFRVTIVEPRKEEDKK